MTIYGMAVKDQDILNELNDNGLQYGNPIQDKTLLNELGENVPNENLLQKISQYIPSFKMPTGLNVASGLMSLAGRNPQEQNIISNIPQIFSGQKPSTGEAMEHALGRAAPAMMFPEVGATGLIPRMIEAPLARIGQQAGFGAATSQNPLEGAKEFGGLQAGMEALGAPFKAVGAVAEFMNPIKYAGNVAEKIRNFAKSGLEEGESYYKPVHAKYDESWVTPTPEKYLGFHPEDRQYFKPIVNKAYRDFIAEPSFKNLHSLQSKMGQQPELKPLRDQIKERINSFLSHDPEMLNSYQMGSNILRDKYYPYIENDVLKGIVEHEKPITKFNAKALSKALEGSSIVDLAKKSAENIQHPLVGLSKALQSKMNIGEAAEISLPIALGLLGSTGGSLIHPEFGALIGAGSGAAAGKYLLPSMLGLAQNESIVNALKNAQSLLGSTGKGLMGYNLSQ